MSHSLATLLSYFDLSIFQVLAQLVVWSLPQKKSTVWVRKIQLFYVCTKKQIKIHLKYEKKNNQKAHEQMDGQNTRQKFSLNNGGTIRMTTIKWKISRKNINSCTNIGKRNRVNCVEYEQNGGKKKSRNEEWILSTFSAMSIHVKNFVWPNRNVQKYRVDQHTILQIQSNSRVTKTSNASLRT